MFDNDERAIVGTLYKQESREAAIDKGLEIFSGKLPDMINKYKKQKGPMIVYCWRGGMRSKAIVSLLKSIGYDVHQLDGGYKQYRKFVRESLEIVKIPQLYVIYGLTGAGKTDMLQELVSIDLEGLAQHRGSSFGDINLNPNSQKMFESLLLKRILELKDKPAAFTEGESRKIGKVTIHEKFWKAMQKGIKIRLDTPIDARVERIYKEYCDNFDKEIFTQKTK